MRSSGSPVPVRRRDGQCDQAMRIWLNPDKMASLKVTTTDVAEAVSSQNKLFSAGQIGGEPAPSGIVQTYPAITQSPYQNADDYENMIIRASNDGSAHCPSERHRAGIDGQTDLSGQYPDERRICDVHSGCPATGAPMRWMFQRPCAPSWINCRQDFRTGFIT